MAKTKAQAAGAEEARRRRSAQTDAERWNRLFIIGGVVAVLLVAAGIIGYGWYQTQVKPLGKVVLRVGDAKFTLAHLERRMRLLQKESAFFQGQGVLQLPDFTLDQLEREGKLLEGAGQLNIAVTDEEVAAEVRLRAGLAQDVEPEIYAAEFSLQVEESGLQEDEYRQMLRAELLAQKVGAYFRFLAPAAEPQVRGRYIVLDDEAEAQQALQRLQAGEDLSSLVTEVATTTTITEPLGDIDWTPRGGLTLAPEEVEDFLFNQATQPDQLSDVISARGLFYITQLLERDDQRALGDEQKERVARRELEEWLGGLSGTLQIRENFTEEDAARALDDVL